MTDPCVPTSELAVRVRNLHVVYRSYLDPRRGLRQLATRQTERRRWTDVHAVRGVTLDVNRGETLGIIGANGSGKSTLLAAMAGLLPARSGTVHASSRPRLLGVGTALRPGVSGRHNILIGGLALGISRARLDESMDELVDFIGIGDAIDRPMNTYSSGQKARLSFAIATMDVPEILFLDEALVVGDLAFRERAAVRMLNIVAHAGSVVLVSHNLDDIVSGCNRAIWLDDGLIQAEGDPAEVVDRYRDGTERTSTVGG